MATTESKEWKSGMGREVAPAVDASWQKRYAVAAGAVLAAFLLRLTLFGSLDTRLPFGFFLVAVMFAAWYGGMGPGLFVTAVGLLLGGYFFLPHTGTGGALGEAERTAIVVFIANAALVTFLMDNLHSRIRKLRAGDKNNG